MNMQLTAATAENLRRKAAYADAVQMRDGVPVFSWIELNICELCQRSFGSPKACQFCPRIDPAVYPNQPLHMSLALAQKIGDELRSIEYQGAVALCGFGEPLLHPDVVGIVRALHGLRVEIITNGDRLSVHLIRDLIEAGTSYFAVSLYDGPEQVAPMHALFREAGYGREHYTLRDRWHGADQDFGLKLTNRAGTINVGNQASVDVNSPCQYLAYQITIDWNGDGILCPQDWGKRIRFGSVANESLMSIWTSKSMKKRRMQLFRGRAGLSPCSDCNTDGCAHGDNHVRAWKGE